jgi:Zn-dependent peptidase ImmA (M78 family)
VVRELLRLDLGYYSTTDDSLVRDTLSRLRVAGVQILKRPTILGDAIRTASLKALYLPDQKRILIDSDLPTKKQRWSEAHEVCHDIIPWHAETALGDAEQTLTPACHVLIESEANYGAGQLLFLARRFELEASDSAPSINLVRSLAKKYDNSVTSTLWRLVEQVKPDMPMVGLVTGHPHPNRRVNFDPANPCAYCIQSAGFAQRFGNVSELELFRLLTTYCGAQRGGILGAAHVTLRDYLGSPHLFHFETFFNRYQALSLGVYVGPHPVIFAVTNA